MWWRPRCRCNANLMRQMLIVASEFDQLGMDEATCHMLNRIYKRCDGNPDPHDLLTGEAVQEFANMVNELILYQCE